VAWVWDIELVIVFVEKIQAPGYKPI